MDMLLTPDFWIGLVKIVWINIILSGDNAVVIALACRSLPPRQQKPAIVFGSVGAITLRVVLTFFAVYLLNLPWLKLVGAAALLWTLGSLLSGDDDEGDMESHAGMLQAIKTIIIADLVMSLDNVIGVAAAAKGDVLLLVIGLVISIPLIIFGSTIILTLMNRFPVIITAGAALLGWVAGEMAVGDPAIRDFVEAHHSLHTAAPVAGAVLVVLVGKWLGRRAGSEEEEGEERTPADQPTG
jgi:YjbE family integral membrane protein